MSYLDDSYFQSQSNEHCAVNISATKSLLLHLDFTIKDDKSVLEPTQKAGSPWVCVGFEIYDSLLDRLLDRRQGKDYF